MQAKLCTCTMIGRLQRGRALVGLFARTADGKTTRWISFRGSRGACVALFVLQRMQVDATRGRRGPGGGRRPRCWSRVGQIDVLKLVPALSWLRIIGWLEAKACWRVPARRTERATERGRELRDDSSLRCLSSTDVFFSSTGDRKDHAFRSSSARNFVGVILYSNIWEDSIDTCGKTKESSRWYQWNWN